MNKISSRKKKILILTNLFVFLAILSDIPLVILFTVTRSVFLAKALLYGTELTICLILAYLLVRPPHVRPPVYINLYIFYILLLTVIGLLFYDNITVLRSSRKFIALVPPLVLGYYLGLFFREEREKYIRKLIMFLTVMSVIGLIEWLWWLVSPDSIIHLCFKYFDISSYYHHVRESSNLMDSGIMTSTVRPSDFLFPGVVKRLTGLYFEPFSAGFNSTLAVILILYSEIAGFMRREKRYYLLLSINILAAILTTSRSTYLFLFVSILVYTIIQRRFFLALVISLLVLLYLPLKSLILTSVYSLGGEAHKETVFLFINYFLDNVFSFTGLLGSGIGSGELYANKDVSLLLGESGYGFIFLQLGLCGLVSIFLLYLSVVKRIPLTRANKFFILTFAASTFALLFFSGYIFGYKTYGLIHLFLGFIMTQPYYNSTFLKGRTQGSSIAM